MRRIAVSFFLLVVSGIACAGTPPAGRIENFRFHSNIFDNDRYVRVWLPPGYDDAANRGYRYPVLYMHDGQFVYHATATKGMRGDWHADEVAAKLIAAGKIEPIVIVAIDNGGKGVRTREYLPVIDAYDESAKTVVGDRMPDVVFEEIVPFINSKFRTREGPDSVAIGGSSFGAVAALYCAIAKQGSVGKLLLESPSLYIHEGWLFKQLEEVKGWPQKIYVGIGTNEVPNNAEYSREAVDDVLRFEKMMKKAGFDKERMKVVIGEGTTHDENAWAGRFPEALKFLFGREKRKD